MCLSLKQLGINTNDNDVYVVEVRLMIESLKEHDKDFKDKIFQNRLGGHNFNRIDSKGVTNIHF